MMTADPRALGELAGLFLKLGITAFGGPAAHIAMMEEEVVRRRRWLTEAEFLDLIGATNLIPGPNSTEVAIHVGHRRAGWAGFAVAGACFILPAAIIVTVLAWAYVRYGQVPEIAGALYGVKPVIIAIVLRALWTLGRTAVKGRMLAVLAAAAVACNLAGMHELLVLLSAGLAGIAFSGRAPAGAMLAVAPVWPLATAAGASAASGPGLWPLFVFFVKIGSVLFGSGYVLLAFLRADLVERWQWLTEAQLLDAVAVGQITPGPVFTTATFIGYLLAGTPGACVATVGIFLPAFFFVAISGPLIPRMRRSRIAGAFLDGVNVASLALMGVVTWQLGRSAIVDSTSLLLALVSAGFVFAARVNSAWLVLAGAAIGWMQKTT